MAITSTSVVTKTTATRKRTLKMNILSWTVNDWYWACQVISLVLLAGTVILGAGALLAGRVLNNRQAAQILGLQTGLTVAKTKQREAERTLLEIQERFAPRRITDEQLKTLADALSNARKRKIIVGVSPVDPEAFAFASRIDGALRVAGYDTGEAMESIVRFEGPAPTVGIKMAVPGEGEFRESALSDATSIRSALAEIGIDAQIEVRPNASDDFVRIEVGSKP